ncbi:DUF4288 domain-containing protein [Amycolatopsis sp. NPDC049868]|uniref:DUF4288 domain-containing protein n=1 Tax=Amycolatopsis sp. NPDC049868 TaxID=3363934 RepID=UPI00379B4327
MNERSAVAGEKGRLFAAVIVYESLSSAPDAAPLYEETVTLFVADTDDEARSKAHLYGVEREVSYQNRDGDTITWKLKHVIDVAEVADSPPGDRAEIYTRHFRNYQAYEMFESLLGKTEL